MANSTHSEYKNVELRKLNADVLCDIVYILEIDNDWKKVMSLIPKDLQCANVEAKYTSEHIRLIEEHAKATNQKCTEIMFDEWGTSGRVRPTLNTLKEIVIRAEIFRAADEIARLLKELPPLRPNNGPPAPITMNITEMIDNESSATICDSKIMKLCNGTTKEMKSASNMIIFSDSLLQESTNMFQNNNMIEFSKEKPTSSMNIPDLSAMIGEGNSSFSHIDTNSQRLTSSASDTYESSTYVPNLNNQHNQDIYQTSFPNIDISQEIDSVILNDVKLKHFEYDYLKLITNNFSENLSTTPYLTGKIGSGGFGEVFVGTHSLYGLLAVKKSHNNLPKNIKPDIKVFNTEVKFLSHFRHKNIVPILGYSIDGPAPCIVCEYIEGGSLYYNIAAKTLNKKQRMSIIVGTAEGLKYLHTHDQVVESNGSQSQVALEDSQKSTKNFVHGDVKSANILLTQDYVPKLCDFGLSKQYEATTFVTNPQGTTPYMAHEMLHGTITQLGDIYSFGIVLLELLTGLKPIITSDSHKYNIKDYVEENLSNNDITELLDPVVGEWSKAKEIYTLSQQCLKYDRKSRPSIVEVCDSLYAI